MLVFRLFGIGNRLNYLTEFKEICSDQHTFYEKKNIYLFESSVMCVCGDMEIKIFFLFSVNFHVKPLYLRDSLFLDY